MSTQDSPLVYIILGAAGSGRREVLADLIEGGLGEGETSHVLLAASEAASPADARLGETSRWTWSDKVITATIPAGRDRVFLVTDGRGNPVDQIEALKPWLESIGMSVARVICVVNCKLAEAHPELSLWYDACIHFSDVVLLNHREGVANKWLSDFRRRYEDLFFPCLFEFVKAGRIKNPALILEPQARRMSLYFDEDGSSAVALPEGDYVFEDAAADLDDEEGEPGGESPAGDEGEDPGLDPYFALDAAGRRVKRIPDIAKFVS